MKFYFMKESADLKTIGKYPQLEKMFDGFHAHYPFEAWGVFNSRNKVPMEKATGFKMKYHAKMTDWISFVQVGFGAALISERLFHLFSLYNPMPFISVDAEVNHRNKTYPYKFLYFTESFDSFIDFQKSRFYIGFGNRLEKDVVIKSFEAFEIINNTLDEDAKRTGDIKRVKLLELHIDINVANKDLFRFQYHTDYIITERLMLAMEEHGITGLKFEPVQGHKYYVLNDSEMPVT